jgi:16S rRNA (adenine1518-N6/adenine1519-N6)-dimethyltransferase
MYDALEKIDAKKSLGQHFLNNPHIPRLMADAGAVERGDTVLEIGPGTGVLTRELLARGAQVIAIEADARAIESLQEPFRAEITAKKLVILHADMRTFDLHTLGLAEHSYKVVANIPYYLSGRLFRTFLESTMQPSLLVFLVQKEVAERIVRDPKESLLSLSVKVFGTPIYVKTVKKGNFTPPPKVDSAVIAVNVLSHDRLQGIDETFFFTVLHAGFAAKRKQLLGNLSHHFPRETLTHIFSTLGIPLDARGEDVHLETWLSLVAALSPHTYHTPLHTVNHTF